MSYCKKTTSFLIPLLAFSFLIAFVFSANAQLQQKSIDEILSLQGQEFYRQANQFAFQCLWQECSDHLLEFWRLLDHIEQQTDKDESIESLLATGYLASAILKYGSNEDYQELLTLYDTVPSESRRQSPFLDALSAFWIKQELAKVFSEEKPQKVEFVKSGLVLPTQLANASEELKLAWMMYKEIVTTYETKLGTYKDKKWIYTQNSWPVFYEVIADFLHDKEDNTIGKMTQFEWGGWCGTGSDTLLSPKARTIWMAFLKERNYPLVLGALLSYMNQGSRMMLNANQDFLWQKQFIEWCGFDWETLLVGAVLDGHAEFLRFLGTYGSQKTAQYLSLMGSQAMDGWTQETYLRSVAAFITPGCVVGNYGTGSSADITRQNKDEIPQETQKKLLDILTAQINTDVDRHMMDTVSHLLTPLCRSETKDALKKILQSPYSEPRKRAVIALQALGEKVEIPPDPGPVYFRLLINDAPLANKNVEWTLKQNDQMSTSSSVHTNENGQFSFQRDYLVDSTKDWKLMLSSGRNMKNIDDVFFNLEANLPKSFDKPIDIRLETSALTLSLHLNHPDDYYKGKQMGIRLHYNGPGGGGLVYFQAVGEEFKLPVTSKITFPHLTPGEYYITIFVPGSAMWAQQNIKLGKEPQELKIDLQPGADLKFDIVALGGSRQDQNVPFNLLTKEGRSPGVNSWPVNYDYMTKSYRGLPLGEYEFTILSSEEKKKQEQGRNNRRESREETFPNMQEYQGEKRIVVIDDKSPDVIDLGTIELKPAGEVIRSTTSKTSSKVR